MKRKTPWHSPSECSFDGGYRTGMVDGQIKMLELLAKSKCVPWQLAAQFARKYKLLKAKQKAWREGRTK